MFGTILSNTEIVKHYTEFVMQNFSTISRVSDCIGIGIADGIGGTSPFTCIEFVEEFFDSLVLALHNLYERFNVFSLRFDEEEELVYHTLFLWLFFRRILRLIF